MNIIQAMPDIPLELRRPIRYDGAACKHLQRRFVNYPDEPQKGQRIRYTCQDCGRRKEMKV